MAEQHYLVYALDKDNPHQYIRRELDGGNFIGASKRESAAVHRALWVGYEEEYDVGFIDHIKIGEGAVVHIDNLPIFVDYLSNQWTNSLHELDTDTPYVHAVPKLNFHARTDEAVKASHSAEEGLARRLCDVDDLQNRSINFMEGFVKKALDAPGDENNRLGFRPDPNGLYQPNPTLDDQPVTKGEIRESNNNAIAQFRTSRNEIADIRQASKEARATLFELCKGVDLVLLRTAMINGLAPYALLHTSISQVDANGHLPANNLYEGHEAAPIHEILHRHLEGALEVHYPEVDGKLTSAFGGSRTRHEAELGKVIALLEARDSPFLPLKAAAKAVAAALQRGDVVAKWPETADEIAAITPTEGE